MGRRWCKIGCGGRRSNSGARPPDGMSAISPPSSDYRLVNLNSEPWRSDRTPARRSEKDRRRIPRTSENMLALLTGDRSLLEEAVPPVQQVPARAHGQRLAAALRVVEDDDELGCQM